MKNVSSSSGSLDMLLDTMCNTFGGVCFIALMVAIISASLPSNQDDAEADAHISEQMVINKETARLVRDRDELKAAIQIQKTFVAANNTNEVETLSAARLMEGIASNSTAVAKLKSEKLLLEDKLAKITTDVAYNVRESMRLERLLKDLKAKLGNQANMKQRSVRTPVERELAGYRSLDVWIRNARMYCLWNLSQVDVRESHNSDGKCWTIIPRQLAGYVMNETFFSSPEYLAIIGKLDGKIYMRIYCDSNSFAQLCSLRDDLIRRRKTYNWHVCNEQTIHFVEGYDGRVQ